MLVPVLLGVIHALVDASTVTAVTRASHLSTVPISLVFAVVATYDIVAFGSQVLLGWVTDRFTTPRIALLAGLVLTAVGLITSPHDALATVVVAGIGNALFHLGAGALVLGRGINRAAPAGVFVAPGSLGLAFGLFYGTSSTRGPLWPLLLLTVTATLGVVLFRNHLETMRRTPASSPKMPELDSRLVPLVLGLLLLAIAVRSLVGLSAARGLPRTELLLFGLPMVAFLGKAVGGFLSDRFGWVVSTVAALLLSIPLISMPHPTAWLLVGLFLFQLPMSVTLTATARLMPHRLATAFGWTCLALILGALPTMFSFGRALCLRAHLGAWIALGTLCLAVGLSLLEPKSTWLALPRTSRKRLA